MQYDFKKTLAAIGVDLENPSALSAFEHAVRETFGLSFGADPRMLDVICDRLMSDPASMKRFFTEFDKAGGTRTGMETSGGLAVYVDPGSASSDTVAELYLALAAYYRSLGGSGLMVIEDETREIPQEVFA